MEHSIENKTQLITITRLLDTAKRIHNAEIAAERQAAKEANWVHPSLVKTRVLKRRKLWKYFQLEGGI